MNAYAERFLAWLRDLLAYSPEKQSRSRKYPALRYKITNPLYKTDEYKLAKLIRAARFSDCQARLKTLPLGLFGFIDPEKMNRIQETGLKDIQAIANRELNSLEKIFDFLNRKELTRMKRICDELATGDPGRAGCQRKALRRRVFNRDQADRIAAATLRSVEINFDRIHSLKQSVKEGADRAVPGASLVWVYIAFDDFQTCPVCRSLHGKYLPFGDERLLAIIPPFHLGCRCTVSLFQKSALTETFETASELKDQTFTGDYHAVVPEWE